MNTLFGIFICISLVLVIFFQPSLLLSSITVATEKAFTLSATLVGIYAFWMGIIKILEKTPALARLERFVAPVVCRIFPNESKKVRKLITMNITANMLGVGGAATPLAIAAIKQMRQNAYGGLENKKSGSLSPRPATRGMIMLFVLNATSLQILPTTIISLRTAAGSTNPASILLPTLIASSVATAVGVGLVGELGGGRGRLDTKIGAARGERAT